MSNNLKNSLHISIYMIVFSGISTFLAERFLHAIGLTELLPVTTSYAYSLILGLSLGLLFKERLLASNKSNLKLFFSGMSVFIVLLALFDIGAVWMIQSQFHGTNVTTTYHLVDYVVLYFLILMYSFFLVATWLAPVAGMLFVCLHRFVQPWPKTAAKDAYAQAYDEIHQITS